MTTLMINDLPQNDELDSKAMVAVTGGDGVVDNRLQNFITEVNLYTYGCSLGVPKY